MSKLIDIFRSPLSITSTHGRLATLLSCWQFFENWCSFWEKHKTRGQNNFITKEFFTDILYCINGFSRLCTLYCEDHPIQPNLINSDVIENIFCQQRATCSGPNTNPDAKQYTYMTMIIKSTCLVWCVAQRHLHGFNVWVNRKEYFKMVHPYWQLEVIERHCVAFRKNNSVRHKVLQNKNIGYYFTNRCTTKQCKPMKCTDFTYHSFLFYFCISLTFLYNFHVH